MSNLSLALSDRRITTVAPSPEAAPTRARFGLRRRRGPDGTLAGLGSGEGAVVHGFDASLDGPTTRRLFDLGFAPGAPVELVRRAPLGDPSVFRVADTEIALRRRHASAIRITTAP